MKYFRKVNPRQSLYMTDGTPILFEAIDRDTGIYPPEGKGISEHVIKQIELAIAGDRGGVSEITASEYNELVQKKKGSPPLKKAWRQEWSMGQGLLGDTNMLPSLPAPQAPAVAEAKPPVAVAEAPRAAKR